MNNWYTRTARVTIAIVALIFCGTMTSCRTPPFEPPADVDLPKCYDVGNVAEYYGRCPRCNTWVKGYFTFWDGTDSEGQGVSGAEYMGRCSSCGTYVHASDDQVINWKVPRILEWKKCHVRSTSVYRVKAGDTLSSIARKHGIMVKEILDINSIPNPDHITVGQKILLPQPKKE